MCERSEKDLRELVAREIQVLTSQDSSDINCRDSCLIVLDAIRKFLTTHSQTLPREFICRTLSRIIHEIGPEDTIFRNHWLEVLRFSKSTEALELALEYIPCTSPLRDENERNELISVLNLMAQRNGDVLYRAFVCLQHIVRKRKIDSEIVFQFLLQHLPRVPSKNIDEALCCVLEFAKDDDECLNMVVHRLKDMTKVESAPEVETSVQRFAASVKTLIEMKMDDKHEHFFYNYLLILEDQATSEDREVKVVFNFLDACILFLHLSDEEHQEIARDVLDTAIESNFLNAEVFALMNQILLHETVVDQSMPWYLDWLCMHLVGFVHYLASMALQSPKHSKTDRAIFSLVEIYTTDLMEKFQPDQQKHLVWALSEINDKSLSMLSRTEISNVNDINSHQKMVIVIFDVLTDCVHSLLHESYNVHLMIEKALNSKGLSLGTTRRVCKLLVLLTNCAKDEFPDKSDFLDPFNVARALLFSTTDQNYKCARGMILSSEIILYGGYPASKLALLWQSIRSSMLPSTNDLVDPHVGIEGLNALRQLHEWMCNSEEDHSKIISPGIFATMTSILTASRLVQYLSSINNASNKKFKVGYADRPNCFKEPKAKKKSFHKMIFSFEALLNNRSSLSPSIIVESFQWVFALIDTYLILGRTKSKGKWIPEAWVEASFYYPPFDVGKAKISTTRQQKAFELVSGQLQEYDASNETMKSNGHLEKQAVESLKLLKRSERSTKVRSLLGASIRYCFSLALSLGILKNVFQHFNSALQSLNTQQFHSNQKTALCLMQYQLAKIYDLMGKCQVMEAILRNISNANQRGKRRRRMNAGIKRNGAGSLFDCMNLDRDIQEAANKLQILLSSIRSTDEFVKTKSLLYSLVDPSHDKILIQFANDGLAGSNDVDTGFSEGHDVIVLLRLNLIDHLIRFYEQFRDRGNQSNAKKMSVAQVHDIVAVKDHFANFLRLACAFSLKLSVSQTAKYEYRERPKIQQLAQLYFRLARIYMELSVACAGRHKQLLRLNEFLQLYNDVLGSTNPLQEKQSLYGGVRVPFRSVKTSFLNQLSKCEDSGIANELLETLSYIALSYDTNDAIREMVNISWTAIHSKLERLDTTSLIEIPFSLNMALEKLAPGAALIKTSNRSAKDVAIRETILKVATKKSTSIERNTFQLQGMIRHWSFLALAEQRLPISGDHLHELYRNVHAFLSNVDGKVPMKRRSRETAMTFDDEDYIPPRMKPQRLILPESHIPGLDSRNHYIYFQVLLDMIISSCALFQIHDEPEWVDPLNGPYRELCKVIETFGLLISQYTNKIKAFPQQGFPSILNSCRSMLNVVSYQSQKCVEWRNSQAALTAEQIELDAFDMGSVKLLSRVFDTAGVYVVGSLLELCDRVESLCTKDEEALPLFGPTQAQKVKSLRSKIRKVSSELESLAVIHKLSIPRWTLNEEKDLQPLRKRRRVEVTGFLQFEESTGESEDTNDISAHTAAFGSRGLLNQEATTSERTWDSESSDEEDSFVVDGNWGRESDDEDDS